MLARIEAFLFVFGGDAQADGHIDQLKEDQGTDDGDEPGDRNSGQLTQRLEMIALKKA